ncbi:YbaK/EbsC family protein [Tardiphaga sp. OK245]|jgi:prolyl-tRNA editing enzyme YbaK/EbsC (Cys-tRNA(Pro) deacylase)|uniref:YbaK/EbsC family protein n=1 Tax=Tardiphaga sp. OK245 TaxID=1855306 RepID=UPI0008A7645B|nr:YbaK/EbsC family protein [Tardiphaga sp. OK245]SEH56564.1 Cys-tRNA(Pro) deacylase, prolyl-tRNA editing enzyme YbaK/EbsC [Tardiphaga sp. OK245]
MSLESVRAFLTANAPELSVTVTDKSSATVLLAAEALGVEPGQIAKTLSVRVGDRVVLVVTKGTARLDNKKARDALGGKPRMLGADEVVALTGHPVGGVCPFGLATPLQVYCDVSLREFAEVWPAAGSVNSSVRMSPARMAELTGASWVDVCQEPAAVQEQAPAMG